MARIFKLTGAGLFAAFLLSLPTWSTADKIEDSWLNYEITTDGPALFYSVDKDVRHELWSVHCSQPLRGCIARAPGLTLRLDENQQPWLIAVAPSQARISIQRRNYTQDADGLFAKSLHPDTVQSLSETGSFVVIEESGRVIQRTRTTALNRVVSYLRWVNGATARTLRDARLWPEDGPLNTAEMSDAVLERYEVLQRRRKEGHRQLVPATKPQIEFAIQAQNGTSFYSNTGDSGY